MMYSCCCCCLLLVKIHVLVVDLSFIHSIDRSTVFVLCVCEMGRRFSEGCDGTLVDSIIIIIGVWLLI